MSQKLLHRDWDLGLRYLIDNGRYGNMILRSGKTDLKQILNEITSFHIGILHSNEYMNYTVQGHKYCT